MRSQDIQIPEPCHAEWDAMRPEEKGRFCFSCSKKVHDLSAMTKDEATAILRRAACEDVCVSYLHHEDGTVMFREPALAPAPVVPLARLRRPRSMVAAVAGAGMAAALAACAPHGDAVVRRDAAEAPVFEAPSVVIPHGGRAPEPEPPRVVEDEPCDPVSETTETVAEAEAVGSEPVTPRVRGRLERTAGKPMPMRMKGGLRRADRDRR